MARYTGPVCRLCRREYEALPKVRLFSDKCAIDRKNYAPGQHGQGRSNKVSMSPIRKSKVRRVYGVLENNLELISKKLIVNRVTGENF